MGYIHRAHHCPKPTDGRFGDIWECDECRRRWQMTILSWLPYVPTMYAASGCSRRHPRGDDMSRIILCEEVGDPRTQKSRCRVIDMSRAGCDPQCGKYVGPPGHVDQAEWAEDMLRTHEQRQCPGCERWTIWEPIPDELVRGGAT